MAHNNIGERASSARRAEAKQQRSGPARPDGLRISNRGVGQLGLRLSNRGVGQLGQTGKAKEQGSGPARPDGLRLSNRGVGQLC